MKALLILSTGFALSGAAHAIPNSFFGGNSGPVIVVPAHPRFNADLTEEFFEDDRWRSNEFSGPWEKKSSLGDREVKVMSAMPVLFGEVPMGVKAYSNSDGVVELAIDFLDAGQFFGYRYGGEDTREEREIGRDRRREFSNYFKQVAESVRERLEDGCGDGKMRTIGRSPMLRIECTDFEWEDFVLRFVEREDHSVSLHLYRKSFLPTGFVDREVVSLSRRDRQDYFSQNVTSNENGDLKIHGLPMMTQGNTPFCGIHSLAMAGYYLGLRMSPEELAASADFKNTGSAGGSDILELHRSVAGELDMQVSISPGFKLDRVKRAIEDGFPVIVWRRVSKEREKAHSEYSAARRQDPDWTVPELTEKDRESLPDKGARGTPSHASIITGINEQRGEVLYMEPWGESTRDRRMKVEEMETSAYAVFFFKP